jgi:hypothetical protein
VRRASVTFSKALAIFLMAHFSPVSVLRALHTTPYAPLPIALMGTYLRSISNRFFLLAGPAYACVRLAQLHKHPTGIALSV